ncbi:MULTISPECIES: hypothetical protein [Vibrio]|uniref:Uncharacterized protein n=1 Tax=Vibrio sp. 1F_97 TaxID=1652827 RepID=A0A0H3ZS88_9VIBR|nr:MULTISPECIES: hypothetical protein [Vibrio]AKN37332.1 hypothetical protein [Vibrio sp. 1F_97]ELB2912186.1 hypothetical protein [Vibrio parahaemolyticus]MCR9549005.1 hypothetical protein [Vibrio antiquarius]OEF28067.1 hypothetical protein OA9_00875 [Vibrio cyclitrophicus 1F97]HBI3715641.1 hypothetical protein [Vibrio parahaemolyticus]
MKLIENWKKAWQLWSVQCAFFMALVNVAISLLPLLQQELSITVYALVNALLGIALAVLRVLSQAPKKV